MPKFFIVQESASIVGVFQKLHASHVKKPTRNIAIKLTIGAQGVGGFRIPQETGLLALDVQLQGSHCFWLLIKEFLSTSQG